MCSRLFAYSQSFSLYRFHTSGLFQNRLNPCSHVLHFALAMPLYSHYVSIVWVRCIIYEYHTQRRLKIFKEPPTVQVVSSHKCTELMPSRCILEAVVKKMFIRIFVTLYPFHIYNYRLSLFKMQQFFKLFLNYFKIVSYLYDFKQFYFWIIFELF